MLSWAAVVAISKLPEASTLKAVIPVAGKGTRLRPHTHTIPKPLVNVAGKPILAHIIDDLLAAGVDPMAFVVDRRGDVIPEFVRTLLPAPRGRVRRATGGRRARGAIHRTREFGGGGPLLILLGDTIVRADFRAIVERQANLIGVKAVDDPRRFGVCLVDGDRITGMVEKPETPTLEPGDRRHLPLQRRDAALRGAGRERPQRRQDARRVPAHRRPAEDDRPRRRHAHLPDRRLVRLRHHRDAAGDEPVPAPREQPVRRRGPATSSCRRSRSTTARRCTGSIVGPNVSIAPGARVETFDHPQFDHPR